MSSEYANDSCCPITLTQDNRKLNETANPSSSDNIFPLMSYQASILHNHDQLKSPLALQSRALSALSQNN